MPSDANQFEKFKELLDREYSWPEKYTFKFIIKKTELEYALTFFDAKDLSFRESKAGKYVSLTLIRVMNSSDEVLSVYEKASVIPGLIAL